MVGKIKIPWSTLNINKKDEKSKYTEVVLFDATRHEEMKQKNTSQSRGVLLKDIIGLAAAYSPRAQAQVPSVLAVLTSEFGKGSGVSRRGATKPMRSFSSSSSDEPKTLWIEEDIKLKRCRKDDMLQKQKCGKI